MKSKLFQALGIFSLVALIAIAAAPTTKYFGEFNGSLLGVTLPTTILGFNGASNVTFSVNGTNTFADRLYAGSLTISNASAGQLYFKNSAGTVTNAGYNGTQFFGNGGGLTNIGGIKVYRALLTQAGTAAPSATVLENSLGGTVVWTRGDVGLYLGTLSGAFPLDKTFIIVGTGSGDNPFDTSQQVLLGSRSSANEIPIVSGSLAGPTQADDVMFNTSIEILVYP